MKPTPPKGFTVSTIKFANGTTKLVARSEKGYKSPKLWNGKRWITGPNKC